MQQPMISAILKNKLISKKKMMSIFKRIYIKNDHQKRLKLKKVVFKFKKIKPKFKKKNKLKKLCLNQNIK
jgi:hypothetical protein